MGDATVIGRRDALAQRRPCHQADAVVRPSGGLKVIPSLREGGRGGTGPLLLPLSLSTEARQTLSWRPLYRDVMSFTDF